MTRKYARIFVRGHYLFREGNSFARDVFAPIGGYCVYYHSNIFRNTPNFENRLIHKQWPPCGAKIC